MQLSVRGLFIFEHACSFVANNPIDTHIYIVHDATATSMDINPIIEGDRTQIDTQNVDALLLTPGTSYTLYAVQSDGPDTSEVKTLSTTFTTDSFSTDDLPAGGSAISPFTSYSYDSRDAAFVVPSLVMNFEGGFSLDFSLGANVNVPAIINYFSLRSPYNCPTVSNDQNSMSLLYPSFSSTDGKECQQTYGDTKYGYYYPLIHDDLDSYDGNIFGIEVRYLISSGYSSQVYIITLTKDK